MNDNTGADYSTNMTNATVNEGTGLIYTYMLAEVTSVLMVAFSPSEEEVHKKIEFTV